MTRQSPLADTHSKKAPLSGGALAHEGWASTQASMRLYFMRCGVSSPTRFLWSASYSA